MSRLIKTHFEDSELKCSCGCGKDVNEYLLIMLEALRTMCGFPLKVNSAARCETHNKAIGGKENSKHLYGLAVDIACSSDSERADILENAIKLGFHGVGIYTNFVHLDLRGKERGRVWVKS